jgi:hypothetical protein
MLQNIIKRRILLRIQDVFKPGLLERISYIAVLAVLKPRVQSVSNTSTVTLRVVRGDEMGLKKAAP